MERNNLRMKHFLHCGYSQPLLRKWQSNNTDIAAEHLMLPVFIIDEQDLVTEIKSMPGVYRYGVNRLKEYLEPLVSKGLMSVLLFGICQDQFKDPVGSSADISQNPIVQAVPLLKGWFPNLLIACDVCLCPYTDHGHCGILNKDGSVINELSIQRISEIALAYAKCGAHIVAPSDMMDGRIAAIKKKLSEEGLLNKVSVLSYSVKFASSYYGPFREAAQSAPKFGDRQAYQLPGGSSGLALRAAARDIEEGADMLMVKPGLAYLDIVKQTKDNFPEYPLFIYQVSGEYAMLYHGAKNGAFDLESVLLETLRSMRRSGADCIITYYTPLLLNLLHERNSPQNCKI